MHACMSGYKINIIHCTCAMAEAGPGKLKGLAMCTYNHETKEIAKSKK